MRVVAGIFGVVLILLMLFEFFVTFLLPRRVRRDPRIARGLTRLLWLPWRALARRVSPATADTWLGFFGPFALLFQLVVWTLGLMTGYALLGFYRSQHVSQNWLAALTAMVDVAAFVKATAPEGKVRAADVTFGIGRHAFADLALQFRLERGAVQERLTADEFDQLYSIVEAATDDSVGRETAHRRLAELREQYEPNAEALARFLALDLPRWLPAALESVRQPGVGVGR